MQKLLAKGSLGVDAERARILTGLDPAIALEVNETLAKIAKDSFSPSGVKPMSGEDFNTALGRLQSFAKTEGIALTPTVEAIGVYPKGLFELKLAGFGATRTKIALVSAADRHELAHLFHTLQVRATLLRSFPALRPGAQQDAALVAGAESYLRLLENGGRNYREFEKAVTGASSMIHALIPSANASDLYLKRLEKILSGTRTGLLAGRIRFENGWTLEEVYALFLSKAPLIVGTSGSDLATRIPFILFGVFYATNAPLGDTGVRDMTNDWIAHEIHKL